MNTNLMFSSDKNYWETPWELFNNINRKFKCVLDVCSTHVNKKCDKYYTIEDNGLEKSWKTGKNKFAYCNPPYGKDISKWIKKGKEEVIKGNNSVFLIPARTDTNWFHDYIFNGASYIYFIKGRIKFVIDGIKINSAPFPSCIVVYNYNSYLDIPVFGYYDQKTGLFTDFIKEEIYDEEWE